MGIPTAKSCTTSPRFSRMLSARKGSALHWIPSAKAAPPLGFPRAKGVAVPLKPQPIKQGTFKQGSVFEGVMFYCLLHYPKRQFNRRSSDMFTSMTTIAFKAELEWFR